MNDPESLPNGGNYALLREELESHVRECQTNPCSMCEMWDRFLSDEQRRADEETLRRQNEEEARREFRSDD